MTPTLTAFRWVPPFAQGYVRDLRVRWALEEAGIPYEVVLVDGKMLNTDEFLAWQPFAQVPAYRDGEVEMFESGAIVLHIAGKSAALSPADPAGRARVATWILAALNSMEPHIDELAGLDVFHAGEAWAAARRPQAAAMVEKRLSRLAAWLGDKDYLEGRFTAGDLMMATVLRNLVNNGVLARYRSLDAYRLRCEARPAFGRAMAAQLAAFQANAPG